MLYDISVRERCVLWRNVWGQSCIIGILGILLNIKGFWRMRMPLAITKPMCVHVHINYCCEGFGHDSYEDHVLGNFLLPADVELVNGHYNQELNLEWMNKPCWGYIHDNTNNERMLNTLDNVVQENHVGIIHLASRGCCGNHCMCIIVNTMFLWSRKLLCKSFQMIIWDHLWSSLLNKEGFLGKQSLQPLLLSVTKGCHCTITFHSRMI